jgi:hypothetical protein
LVLRSQQSGCDSYAAWALRSFPVCSSLQSSGQLASPSPIGGSQDPGSPLPSWAPYSVVYSASVRHCSKIEQYVPPHAVVCKGPARTVRPQTRCHQRLSSCVLGIVRSCPRVRLEPVPLALLCRFKRGIGLAVSHRPCQAAVSPDGQVLWWARLRWCRLSRRVHRDDELLAEVGGDLRARS